MAALASVFAALAALLAAIGIYGLLSYTVAQRTREIGIRMALGARIWNIFRLISAQVIGMVASGVALGLGAIVAVPLVTSIVAPTAAQAATCFPSGHACASGPQCCSNLCNANVCV